MRAPLPLALVCVLLAGCATPDLRPFAEQTARLATAVSGEQRQIALKFDQVIELNHEACAKGRRATPAIATPQPCADEADRRRQAADYAESRRIIDAMLEKSVGYAASLAELAAAGETGAAAQPAIVIVADGIRELHAPSDQIAGRLHTDELQALLTLTGADLVGLFRDAALGMDGLGQRLHGLELANMAKCGQDADKAKCSQLPEVLRNADSVGRVLEQLRPQYETYQARRAAAVRWRAERKENLAAIARAASAWQAEHAKAADALARCGGLNAYRCARVDAVTLKAAVDQINEIRSERGR